MNKINHSAQLGGTSSLLYKIVFFLVVIISLPIRSQPIETEYAVQNLLKSIQSLHSLRCTIRNKERIDNAYKEGIQKLEMEFFPFKCHIEFIQPNKGAKVIYADGKNAGNLEYIPNGFPYFNIKLSPISSLARRNNHHTILEAGFSFMADIVYYHYLKMPQFFKSEYIKKNNGTYVKITAEFDGFPLETYYMKKNETIREIAHRNRISEYQILLLNKNLSSFDDWTNEKINIPKYYCQKIEILIDKNNWLPILVKIYDHKGLFEEYSYSNTEVNPKIDSDKFEIH